MTGLGKIYVIVNPNAANGSTGRRWPKIREALQDEVGSFDSSLTGAPGDATRLARGALDLDYDTILSLGGDGTHNEVVNGFLEDGRVLKPAVRLGILPSGTGSDLTRTLRIPRSAEGAIQALRAGESRRVDLGRLSLRDRENNEVSRYFINIASFGMGGAVDEKVNRSTKRLGGFVSFLWGTVETWVHYRNQEVRLRLDGKKEWTGRVLNVAVANGQFFGGGMHIAPRASMDDGLLDVVILGDLTKMEFMQLGPRIYRGTHLDHPKIECCRVRLLEASSGEKVLLDVDGEQPGSLPSRFEVIPGALTVIAPLRAE